MAAVQLIIDCDENNLGKKTAGLTSQINDFNKKWEGIIEKFQQPLFVEDDNGIVWFLIKLHDKIDVSTDEFASSVDKAGYAKSICRFLSNVGKWEGESFSLGEEPFDNEFYIDLFSLFENNGKDYIRLFLVEANVDNVDGYFSGCYNLCNTGEISVAMDYYE